MRRGTRAWEVLVLVVVTFVTGTAFGRASESTTAKELVTAQPALSVLPFADSAPKLPAFVPSAYGPVRVIFKADLTYQGQIVYGLWMPYIRTIYVRAGLVPWFSYAILEHEKCHLALHDFDSPDLDEGDEDRICESIAHQRVLEARSR